VPAGVTVREFVEMCARHAYPGVKRPTIDSTKEFLDRCCELGLLTREGNRYVPTFELGRCFPREDER
jgi:hypothetical protein